MDAKKVVCPSCGSDNVASSVQRKAISVPFGPAQQYDARVDLCNDCELEGDFFDTNEKAVADALAAARKASAISMMNQLVEKNGLGMAHMERVLELPARTMMRWKIGDCSAGALALLRILTTYPWTLDVADAQFDPTYSRRRLAEEGLKAICHVAGEHHYTSNAGFDYGQNGIQGWIRFQPMKGWAAAMPAVAGSSSRANAACLAR